MHNLLSLANSDSHNFTAEVLMRQAAGTWDLGQARTRTSQWLVAQSLPMQGVQIADGSGLDRANRLTSRFLTALLLRMDQHPYGRNYMASMAVAGQRGSLRNLYNGTSLQGRFYGKTGTLTGVRAISGILLTNDGPRYVSTIGIGSSNPNTVIGQVLRNVQDTSLCPI
jgi:D-alanyl-D-alanine carboxypeptidase/D-alanyl-D-alanine-endopeptidase (penicillin-binding protein 4)